MFEKIPIIVSGSLLVLILLNLWIDLFMEWKEEKRELAFGDNDDNLTKSQCK